MLLQGLIPMENQHILSKLMDLRLYHHHDQILLLSPRKLSQHLTQLFLLLVRILASQKLMLLNLLVLNQRLIALNPQLSKYHGEVVEILRLRLELNISTQQLIYRLYLQATVHPLQVSLLEQF